MSKALNLNSLRILNVFYCANNTYMGFNFSEIRNKVGGSNTTLINQLDSLKLIGALTEKQLKKFPFTKNYSITPYGMTIHKSMLRCLPDDYLLGDEGE